MKPKKIQPQPGQESVWDYPRPLSLERVDNEFGGSQIVDAAWAWRVLETSHPPTYDIPLEFFQMDFLRETSSFSHCE